MTGGLAPGSRLIVLGVNAEGSEVTRLALSHGDDPLTLLELHGWQVRSVRDVVRHPVEKHVLTVTFVVEPVFTVTLVAVPVCPPLVAETV